ncbi:LON peptidase substrate-binding domain-containing protein, partial [Maritalea sp.]|uniref:LON peptidase substrate-binding domain-containing protein n=1 Tax=Maritalea sp. TaxID=2003361 RepID=UPI0039E66F05
MSDKDKTDTSIEPGEGRVYPVLPLRDIVAFPGMIVPLFVGREKSVKALEEVMREDKNILVVTQKSAQEDDPTTEDVFDVGTIASVLQLLKLPDGTVKVLIEGISRAKIANFVRADEYFEAEAFSFEVEAYDEIEAEALARSAVTEFENYVKLNKKISPEVVGAVSQIDDHSKLADTIASHLAVKNQEKQEILAINSVTGRLHRVLELMEGEIGVLQVERR